MLIFRQCEHCRADDYVPIAFSHREGIALSTITYNDNGEVRPIFYRLSLVEMVVPYAAPEFPHPRKFAFDVYVFRY
jgi:primary-amine oxidase